MKLKEKGVNWEPGNRQNLAKLREDWRSATGPHPLRIPYIKLGTKAEDTNEQQNKTATMQHEAMEIWGIKSNKKNGAVFEQKT